MHFYLFASSHALREVDQNSTRIKFWFIKKTGKSNSTLRVKWVGKIFRVLTYVRIFYETTLRVCRVGALALFFRCCLRLYFYRSEPIYSDILNCNFDHFLSFLLNFIAHRSFWRVCVIFLVMPHMSLIWFSPFLFLFLFCWIK